MVAAGRISSTTTFRFLVLLLSRRNMSIDTVTCAKPSHTVAVGEEFCAVEPCNLLTRLRLRVSTWRGSIVS
jgi:hypothetical protein